MQVISWKRAGSLRASIYLPIDNLLLTITSYLTIHGHPSTWTPISHGNENDAPVSIEKLRDEVASVSPATHQIMRVETYIENTLAAPQTVTLKFDAQPDDDAFFDEFTFNVPKGGVLVTGFRVNLVN